MKYVLFAACIICLAATAVVDDAVVRNTLHVSVSVVVLVFALNAHAQSRVNADLIDRIIRTLEKITARLDSDEESDRGESKSCHDTES